MIEVDLEVENPLKNMHRSLKSSTYQKAPFKGFILQQEAVQAKLFHLKCIQTSTAKSHHTAVRFKYTFIKLCIKFNSYYFVCLKVS